MLRYEAESTADADAAWALLAQPRRWHEWAPHVRGAWGLGDDEVRAGARGAARLLGVVPVPAVVTDKQEGRSWTWRVGPVDMVHAVRPDDGGCEVAVELHAPAPVEALLARTYGPLCGVLVQRLAARASG